MVRAPSPLMAPESTPAPTAFDSTYGSPVRYDSSIVLRPSTTMPSTGQVSCGNTTSRSPGATSSRATSVVAPSTRRWARVGMRFTSASSADEALPHRVALQRLSAGEHQHDERAGEVLAEDHRRDDGDAGEQIGAEIPADETDGETGDQGDPADGEGNEQWNLVGAKAAGPRVVWPRPAQREVDGDGQQGDRRDRRLSGGESPVAGRGHRTPHGLVGSPVAARAANVARVAASAGETPLPGRRGTPTSTPRAPTPALMVPVGLLFWNIRSTSGRMRR